MWLFLQRFLFEVKIKMCVSQWYFLKFIVYFHLLEFFVLNLKSDGSEDDDIHCFKSGQPCENAAEMLMSAPSKNVENSMSAPGAH